jgi:hypothetical protein
MPAVNLLFKYVAENQDAGEMSLFLESTRGAARVCRRDLRMLLCEARFNNVEPDADRVARLQDEIDRWDNLAERTEIRLLELELTEEIETVPAHENYPW